MPFLASVEITEANYALVLAAEVDATAITKQITKIATVSITSGISRDLVKHLKNV